ncbi:aldo/keto reductase [Mycena crocata]|nr:aldo/keto reductase [Mycena crocata]
MVQKTTNLKLGGTASDVTVGRVAHGLMTMTWTPTPASDNQCFEAIKAGIDVLPTGTKAFLNPVRVVTCEFYAQDLGTANLEMLSHFYAKYPEYAEKTFFICQGPESIRQSVDNIQKALGPNKKVDLFEPARIDRKVPVEDMMQTLATLVKEGKFAHIGLSTTDTLRKAHAVHPVTAVEIEISPFSYEENQKKVIATAAELGISVLAYSYGDFRAHLTRFKEENMKHNVTIVEALNALAQRKGITVAQLCIAWVAALGPGVIPLPGSSKSNRTLENLQGGDVELSAEELQEMNGIIAEYGVKGDRSFGLGDEKFYLWG